METDDTYSELLEGIGDENTNEDLMADAAEDLEMMASEPRESSTLPESTGETESKGLTQASAKAAMKARGKPKKPSTSRPKAKPRPKNVSKAQQKGSAPKARVQQLRGASNGVRSGSASETPTSQPDANTPPPEEEELAEEDIEEEVDSRVYCICQTLYDDEKIMVACDKCDEWYHTECVQLSEQVVELVDKFYCPKCHEVEPSLVTSYKPVCARPECTHAARPPLSKFCSDECGIRTMSMRLDNWDGETSRLLEHPVIAHARPREGMLLPSVEVQTSSAAKMQFDQDYFTIDHIKRQLTQLARDLSRIGERRARDEHRLQQLEALDILLSRAKGRAHESDQGQCGFDYRLLMDDDRLEEWLEAGGRHDLYYPEDEDYGVYSASGPWFCEVKRKCARHSGWEELKEGDFELERRGLYQNLEGLSKHERHIRKDMEKHESYLHAREIAAAAWTKREKRGGMVPG